MKLFFRTSICFLAVFLIFGMGHLSARAATTFSFTTPSDSVNNQGNFDVMVSIQSADYFNTLAGYIEYPTDMVSFVDVSTEHSVIPYWVDQPQDQYGHISFSGIIPGGTSGVSGKLFRLTFHPRRKGDVTFRFGNIAVLTDDGQTLPTSLITARSKTIAIVPGVGDTLFSESLDRVPPEPFEIFVLRDDTLFSNQWFATFTALDADSGIDHYDIQERTDPFPDQSGWQETSAPYILRDQSKNSYIFVRAVDRSGNVRIANYIPPKHIPANQVRMFVLGMFGVLCGVLIWYIIRKIITRKHVKLPSA